MFTAMRPSLKDSPSKHLRNILWSSATSDAAGLEVPRESRRWNTLEGWARRAMMIGNAKRYLTFGPAKNQQGFRWSQASNGCWRNQLCVVTLFNRCTYFPCIGMTIKSCSNRLILDRYLLLNFSGSWESWDQNEHGKTDIFWLGEGILSRLWRKKSLFDSDRPSITYLKKHTE